METYGERIQTPKGNQVVVGIRTGTSDGSHAMGIIVQDEYRLAELPPLEGWALDVGSYAGHVTLALATDHPGLNVIAIDPVPENIGVLVAALSHSRQVDGLTSRIYMEQAAAGSEHDADITLRYAYSGPVVHGEGSVTDEDYVRQNRFMAGLWRQEDVPGVDITVRQVTIRGLAKEYGVKRFVFCKIDCEGGEYEFFKDGAELIDLIVGEYHDGGPERITALLAPTHHVEILENNGGTGLFRAKIR